MNDLRKDCQMRHENGNCNVIGGFCTAVNDSICAGLHNAYDCGYCDGEIRAKQEHPQWISVKDRLPNEKQRVIVRCNTVGTTVGWRLRGEWVTDLGDGGSEVTHWMPLPEPPQKEIGCALSCTGLISFTRSRHPQVGGPSWRT